jgi:uncharacterized membrane protein
MWLFHDFGFSDTFRLGHVIVAIMWMGLLWFFNFVQTPAYAEMEPAARNNAFDKLTWRALWWFRWAAAATLVLGLLIIAVFPDKYDGDFWQSSAGVGLIIGIVLAVIMAANVWMVIWPAQQIVIANARNVQAGGDANPDAPAAARRGAMASRQNTIFSFPVLFFMVGTTHILGDGAYFDPDVSAGNWWIYLLIGLVIALVLELNALGKISGTGNGGLNVIYETHKNAMYTGFGLIALFYILAEIILST